VHPISSFWKKPGNERNTSAAWLSADSGNGQERAMVRSAPAASAATCPPAVHGASWFWSGRYRPGVKGPQSERALV